jgi:hypothetical protein
MGHHQHTATILPFTSRAQMSGKTGGLGLKVTGKSGDASTPPRATQMAFAESWYHQAAIEEASPTRKP